MLNAKALLHGQGAGVMHINITFFYFSKKETFYLWIKFDFFYRISQHAKTTTFRSCPGSGAGMPQIDVKSRTWCLCIC
jgi:hypothetical protein